VLFVFYLVDVAVVLEDSFVNAVVVAAVVVAAVVVVVDGDNDVVIVVQFLGIWSNQLLKLKLNENNNI
jgi:hypothetical protein